MRPSRDGLADARLIAVADGWAADRSEHAFERIGPGSATRSTSSDITIVWSPR
jgi:hypothetical protein